MRLPEIQEELHTLAKLHGIPRLAALANAMYRRTPKTRAKPTSTPMTPLLAAKIRVFKARNPDMSQAEIGRVFNVHPGRVSEAVRGKRK